MKLLLFTILFFISGGIVAQYQKNYAKVDSIIFSIPEKWTSSTTKLAQYINTKFSEESDKVRAIYVWVATNLTYDVENMFAPNSYEKEIELVEDAMKTRKGICGHFAETFNNIAHQVGLQSYSVTGYTQQHGEIDHLSHGWCATQIDSVWYIFDPTWGAGMLIGDRL